MPTLITQPSIIPPVGIKPKLIEEYAGRVATVQFPFLECSKSLVQQGRRRFDARSVLGST